MQRNKAIIWATFILTLLAAIFALMLPVPASWPSAQTNFHQQLVVNIIMAFFHTGGAILFIANLDVYKARLRRAYITMAAGTITTGAGTLQISLLTILDGWQTPYAQSGITMLPFVLSGVLLYLGVRSFARAVEIKHVFTHAWVVLPAALAIAIAGGLLPYIPGPMPAATFHFLVGITLWSSTLMVFTGLLVIAVRKHAGALYSKAMTWLARALFFAGFILFYQGFYTFINIGNTWYLDLTSNLITIISGWLWIRAGYTFALTKYYSEDLPLYRFLLAQTDRKTANRPKTIIDTVTYAAGLASNSQDIDPLLDKLRAITAKLTPGEQPSDAETKSLVDVYLKLEQYLLTREAIRNYTRKEIRSQLDPSLQKQIIMYESQTK